MNYYDIPYEETNATRIYENLEASSNGFASMGMAESIAQSNRDYNNYIDEHDLRYGAVRKAQNVAAVAMFEAKGNAVAALIRAGYDPKTAEDKINSAMKK